MCVCVCVFIYVYIYILLRVLRILSAQGKQIPFQNSHILAPQTYSIFPRELIAHIEKTEIKKADIHSVKPLSSKNEEDEHEEDYYRKQSIFFFKNTKQQTQIT